MLDLAQDDSLLNMTFLCRQHPIIANIAQQFYVSSVPFHSQETSHLIRDKLKLMFKEIRNLSPSTVHYPSVMQLGL